MQVPVVTMLSETPLEGYESRPQISQPEAAYDIIRPLLESRDREFCMVVSLDTKHRILAVDTVGVGTADHTFMAPREIFRTALNRGASAIFVAHNHPSGDPTPSADDRTVTRRLSAAGEMVGVALLDHLVVGDSTFTSLARLGVC